MADIKISELGAASAVNSTDIFPMTSSGVTVKATAQQIKNYMGVGNLSDLDTTEKSSAVAAINEVNTKVSKTEVLIAPVLTSLVAPAGGLSSGDQFVYNGLLYKATAAIAQGGTIIINGNAVLADSVTEQLNTKPSLSIYEALSVDSNGQFTASENGFAVFIFTVNNTTLNTYLTYTDITVQLLAGNLYVPANTDNGTSYTLIFPVIKGHTYSRNFDNLDALYNKWIH